jgi:hypothetical protein
LFKKTVKKQNICSYDDVGSLVITHRGVRRSIAATAAAGDRHGQIETSLVLEKHSPSMLRDAECINVRLDEK